MPTGRSKHIAFFLDHLRGGGIQKLCLIIASALASRGHQVDLVVCDAEGPLRDELPERVRLTELRPSPTLLARAYALAADPMGMRALVGFLLRGRKTSPTLPYLPELGRYLRDERPDTLFTATPYMNIEAMLARRRAGVLSQLVVSEHNDLSHGHPLGRGWRARLLWPMLSRAYREADAIIAVSQGVADDIVARTGISREHITTIYNPVVTPALLDKAREPLDHPWLQPGAPPVVLGAGRLGTAKDFPTLIRAFARVRRARPAHLIILGEARNAKKSAKRRAQLIALATELGVADDMVLPGYVPNPSAYMARAAVFVLSSVYEGFGNVVAEALACGCPVVSTDCPSGPAEILDSGKYGSLVPVRDDAALAEAISRTLESPPDRDLLRKRGMMFSVDRAVERYEALFLINFSF
jgi:glycosyltransferase involved in cell wall biosynthesis